MNVSGFSFVLITHEITFCNNYHRIFLSNIGIVEM